MRRSTRIQFSKLQDSLMRAYETKDLTKTFDIEPPTERKILNKVQDSDRFLQQINMSTVTDSKGQALELGVSGLFAKRTDISKGPRMPRALGGMEGTEWETAFTEFDVSIAYESLDAWARYPDFQQRYMDQVYRIIALNRLLIGWHGKEAAKKTDPETNPNGEDVNYGWLARLKKEKQDHYLGAAEDETITLGKGGDYKNLDTLVFDLFELIPEANRTGNEVAIIGRELLAYDANKNLVLNADDSRRKPHVMTMTNSYAGLQAISASYFPPRALLITDPLNLHLYTQEGASRRQQKEEPEYNRIAEYMSCNDTYTIADLEAIAGLRSEAVKFVEEDAEG
jgi:P2 family phage major capsid protein